MTNKVFGSFRQARPTGDPYKPLIVDLQSLDVAPGGHWAIRCENGSHWTPRREFCKSTTRNSADNFNCEFGHRQDWRDSKTGIVAEDIELIENPSQLFSRTWYHISKTDDLSIDDQRFFHVGTKEAAHHRAWAHSGGRVTHLYELNLVPGSEVYERVLVEACPGLDQEIQFGLNVGDQPIIRYINSQEAPGSVSLILQKNHVLEESLKLVEPCT